MESPGTAPGSDPFITSAFMFIVPKDDVHLATCVTLYKVFYTERIDGVRFRYAG